jgi:ATP-dependent DNA helicase RecG
MNAIMHRDYESNAPVKFYQFTDRIEIVNPGGLYGNARPENFPNVNDYRNPVIAEAMKVLGYVNRFNRGIARVKVELKENGNPEPVFDYDKIGVFGVTVYGTFYEDAEEKISEKASEKIIQLMQEDPGITIEQLVKITGLSRRGVEWNIDSLKKQGIITREGSKKTGKWFVKTVE